MTEKPARKKLRLQQYNYNNIGYYFVTVCTLNRECLLNQIDFVGSADTCAPQNELFVEPMTKLTHYGKIADRYLQSIKFYNTGVKVDKYVIMPNHIHAIIIIYDNGGQGSARPTNILSKIIHSFKRLTNTEFGKNIWQASFYDHIIRNEQDYLRIWQYIDTNPIKWAEDEYNTQK